MKRSTARFTSCCLFILTIFILSSCKKKEAVNYNLLAEDAAISESVANDVFKVVDNESKNGQFGDSVGKTSFTYLSSLDTCAIVTLNTNGGNFPMDLTIDFGSGCTDLYGTVRKGKIKCVYTGPYTNPGDSVIVTAEDYYVNGFKVEGSHIIVNKGRNSDGNLEFSVDVACAITKPDGGLITWNSQRTNEWTEGESTSWVPLGWLSVCDDVYEISGEGEGVTSDGHSYRLVITSPVVKRVCCYWVVQGKVSLEVDGSHVAEVDYGNGACDFSATLIYGNNSYVIVIQ